MTTASEQDTEDPAALREAMVRAIAEHGYLRLPGIRDALTTVPHHRFVPAAPIREAYDPDPAVTTVPNPDGPHPRSGASVPTVVAMMLDQLDPQPGQRILEIGTGTGYNALLAELVGPDGHIVSIDIAPDITEPARRALDALGYDRVDIVTADGTHGDRTRAPYDGIIVTVSPWDLPLAWTRQLAEGGRLVVPLRFRGHARSIVFTRDGDILRSTTSSLCGLIPMEGPSQDGERSGVIDSDANQFSLTWDADQEIDPAALAPDDGDLGAAHMTWSRVIVNKGEPFDTLWLRLAAAEHGTCRIAADTDDRIARLALPARNPAVVAGNTFAYLTIREVAPAANTKRYELGSAAYGPHAATLGPRFAAHIQRWDTDRHALPTITAYPAGTSTEDLPAGLIIDKPSNRIVITY